MSDLVLCVDVTDEVLADFRSGKVSSSNYYKRFMQLFGNQSEDLFQRLVQMLPDAKKQKELLDIMKHEKKLVSASSLHYKN